MIFCDNKLIRNVKLSTINQSIIEFRLKLEAGMNKTVTKTCMWETETNTDLIWIPPKEPPTETTTEFNILMQNVRGFPSKTNNSDKETKINDIIKITKPNIMTIMETGIYGNNKPNLPLFFDKFRSNNIHINPETTH